MAERRRLLDLEDGDGALACGCQVEAVSDSEGTRWIDLVPCARHADIDTANPDAPAVNYAAAHERKDVQIDSIELDYTGGGIYIETVRLKNDTILGIGEGSDEGPSVVLYHNPDCYAGGCDVDGCGGGGIGLALATRAHMGAQERR